MTAFRYALLAWWCLSTAQVWAQQKPRVAVSPTSQPPQYVTGPNQMLTDLQRNAHYPAAALRAQASGRVVVSFVVEADGAVGEATIVSSASPLLNDAVLQAVKGLGAFIPAQANGKPVRGTLTCPVTFRMTSSTTTRSTALVLAPLAPVQPQALAPTGNIVLSKLASFRDSTYYLGNKSYIVNQHYFTYDRQGRPETHRLDYLKNGRPASSQVLRYRYRPDGRVAAKTNDYTKYVFDYTDAGQLSSIRLFLLMQQKWRLVEETQLVEKTLRKNGSRILSLTMGKTPANPVADSTLHVHSTIDYTLLGDNSIAKSTLLSYDYKIMERPSTYTFKQDSKPNPFENLFVERWYQVELERGGPHNLVAESQNGRPFKAFNYTYNAANLPTECRISNGVGQSYRVQQYTYAGIVMPASQALAVLATDSVSGLSIYPNPATSATVVKAARIGPGEATLRLIDTSGQVVRKTIYIVTTTFAVDLPVASLEKGVYIVEVTSTTAVVKGKLLVE